MITQILNKLNRKKGFTLIELLTVLVIIGLFLFGVSAICVVVHLVLKHW